MLAVADLVPKTGFFVDYLRWVTRLCDAPEIYHVGASLAALSAVVGGRARGTIAVKLGDDVLISSFPTNLWILAVGPSTDRKSTACKYAVNTVLPIIQEFHQFSGSYEGTFDLISQHPEGLFFHSEGQTLFSQLKADYWTPGQGFLCDLYDGRDEPGSYKRTFTGRRTKTDGEKPKVFGVEIKSPRLTLLIGVATDLLDEATRKSDWSGGLLGRMMMLYAERQKFNVTELEDDEGREKLREQLRGIRFALEEYECLNLSMQKPAMDMYAAWSTEIDKTTREQPPKLKPLLGRLPKHILRVSALYAISQFYDSITVESMEPALRLGSKVVESINRVGDILSDDPVMRQVGRIREILASLPDRDVKAGEITRRMRTSWGALQPAINTLVAVGEIRQGIDANTEGGGAKVIRKII